MGCGSSVTSREPVLAPTVTGVNVPFHPELTGSKSGDEDVTEEALDMRTPTSPGRSILCSICGVPEDTIPLQLRNDMYYCDTCNHDSETHLTDEDDMPPPHSMMEKALAYRPQMTMEGCEAILSRYLRRYPAYMAENDQCEIIDIEACRQVNNFGMSCEEMTAFSADALTSSTRGDATWRSHSESQSEGGRGSGALHFNRPATPSGVVTSEPSHVSQFFRRTLTSFKARLAFSDDGSPTDAEAEAAPKYLLSPIKESVMVLSDDGSGILSPRKVASPLSKSLTPRRAAVQDAITTFRKERDKDLSESQQRTFERVRAWSELNLIFLLGTPPSEVTGPLGRSIISTATSDSPGPSGRRKPKKLHLSSSTLHTLQMCIRNRGIVEGGTPRRPSFEEDPVTSLAEVVSWYYGTAPLGMPSSPATPSHQELADLYPPCLLEHMHHPVYGYALEHHNSNAFKCISVTLARITREFNAQACPSDIVITTY